MSDTTPYTQDELAEITLISFYRVLALEIVLTGVVGALPETLAKLSAAKPETLKQMSEKIMSDIPEMVQQRFLQLLSEDSKISTTVKESLRKSFGDIKFDGE